MPLGAKKTSLLDYHFHQQIFNPTCLLGTFFLEFHPTRLANFLPYLFIWAYFFMKFTQNIHPTRLLGPTRLIGT